MPHHAIVTTEKTNLRNKASDLLLVIYHYITNYSSDFNKDTGKIKQQYFFSTDHLNTHICVQILYH